ncbi:hypothetical protein [Streptomyces sp. NPDC052192]|uniref:hypothetical protein n=1 Tax=Streptomyces sp. NPDC052192 TaxID=3155052 RepID=UPI003414DCC6
MERKTRTRPATAAERLAARALGKPEPTEVEVETTPTSVLHMARLSGPRKSAKPKGMQTSAWYGQRIREVYGVEDPEEDDEGGGYVA